MTDDGSLHSPCHPPWLQVHIYDAVGNYISKMNLYCLDDAAAATQLVGIDWYDGAEGYSDPGQPTLALGMENGRLQLQRHETDENPVLIDTGMVRRMRAYARAYACGAGWVHPHRSRRLVLSPGAHARRGSFWLVISAISRLYLARRACARRRARCAPAPNMTGDPEPRTLTRTPPHTRLALTLTREPEALTLTLSLARRGRRVTLSLARSLTLKPRTPSPKP